MQSADAEFSGDELAVIREMLAQRYRKEIEIHLADSEVSLDRETAATCPTVYWHARGANFVVFKLAPQRYRTQFFYTPHEQFGTGIDEYADIGECVAAALQTQADHERDRAGAPVEDSKEKENK